jgi:hypothetical protein
MGASNSVIEQRHVAGIGFDNRYVTLKQILDKHKDLENLMEYIRIFTNHHLTLQGKETDFQAEIYYANSLIRMAKPYTPMGLKIPVFDEKPPAFGENHTIISANEYRAFILDCLEYFATLLASITIE